VEARERRGAGNEALAAARTAGRLAQAVAVRLYARSAELRSDTRGVLRVRLRRHGRYTLVCLQADHARRGMRATLRVR
jgi:hypothetical protein